MEVCSGQLEKAICKSVLSKGEARAMDGYENIIVHTYKCDSWITSVIENKVSVSTIQLILIAVIFTKMIHLLSHCI